MRSLILIFLVTLGVDVSAQEVTVEPAFPNLSPFDLVVDIEDPADGENRLYVVQHKGKVFSVENEPGVATRELFLDITDRVGQGTEQGIYSIAFHPDYEENGYVYVYYLSPVPLRSIVARYERSADDPATADPDSETIILDLEQPGRSHNGGQVAFGSDGYLYVSLGDGQCCGDPDDTGQDPTTLYGSLLRLDVDNPAGGQSYGIPADNPFVGNDDGWREEIWAFGLRNPWRFSFDRATGDLWLGDVGEALWEEVNLVEGGKNYGWSAMEGFECYGAEECDQAGLVLPIYAYGRDVGQSVTGGFVYRGAALPQLAGKYIYGDYVSGTVWALDYASGEAPSNETLFDTDLLISTFGEDEDGEIYLANFIGTEGSFVYRIADGKSSTTDEGPEQTTALTLLGPNPFADRTALAFSLHAPGPARLAVYDMLGREVAVLFDGTAVAGTRTVSLDAAGLAAGAYIVRFETALGSATKRVTVVR